MCMNLRARLWAVKTYKHFGWACMAGLLSSGLSASPNVAGVSCVALLGWGAACFLPGLSDQVRVWAKGTRPARKDLFAQFKRSQSPVFRKMGAIDQAAMARLDPNIQRRFWWDASAVMWMLANHGKEHAWRGMLSAPGWFDDSIAWRDEIMAKLEEAADEGWICPSANMAWLLGRPEMGESKRELGEAISGFAQLGDPWPSQARFCDTLASMGHKLYNKNFGEALAWRSHGALERLRLCSNLEALGGNKLRSKGRLRL
jgi:hypothetical protein